VPQPATPPKGEYWYLVALRLLRLFFFFSPCAHPDPHTDVSRTCSPFLCELTPTVALTWGGSEGGLGCGVPRLGPWGSLVSVLLGDSYCYGNAGKAKENEELADLVFLGFSRFHAR
jgi:hypothetical protein